MGICSLLQWKLLTWTKGWPWYFRTLVNVQPFILQTEYLTILKALLSGSGKRGSGAIESLISTCRDPEGRRLEVAELGTSWLSRKGSARHCLHSSSFLHQQQWKAKLSSLLHSLGSEVLQAWFVSLQGASAEVFLFSLIRVERFCEKFPWIKKPRFYSWFRHWPPLGLQGRYEAARCPGFSCSGWGIWFISKMLRDSSRHLQRQWATQLCMIQKDNALYKSTLQWILNIAISSHMFALFLLRLLVKNQQLVVQELLMF